MTSTINNLTTKVNFTKHRNERLPRQRGRRAMKVNRSRNLLRKSWKTLDLALKIFILLSKRNILEGFQVCQGVTRQLNMLQIVSQSSSVSS